MPVQTPLFASSAPCIICRPATLWPLSASQWQPGPSLHTSLLGWSHSHFSKKCSLDNYSMFDIECFIVCSCCFTDAKCCLFTQHWYPGQYLFIIFRDIPHLLECLVMGDWQGALNFDIGRFKSRCALEQKGAIHAFNRLRELKDPQWPIYRLNSHTYALEAQWNSMVSRRKL